MLRVSYCDHSPSVGFRHPSVIRSHFLVYTVASTNINQSGPNLVKIYMTIRSRMSLIMDLIRPEHLELFALELKKNALFQFVYQSAPNLVKIYMTIRSRMTLILDLIRPE